MPEIDIYLLAGLFLAIAFVYGSVGLGGGSSYTALLTIVGFSHIAIPTISLTLNTIVSSSSAWQFFRNGHVRSRLIWPFLVTSIPMSYLGGRLQLSAQIFQAILLVTLVLVAARIYFWRESAVIRPAVGRARLLISFGLGAVLGFVAGVVGIGGGIYLVPLILILGLGDPKEAAAAGSVFIFINSIAGLTARVQVFELPVDKIIPLAIAVLIGGTAGSMLGAGRYRGETLQKIIGVVILIAIALLIRRLFGG